MKNYIIGISGELNSGKDTFASMVNYIFARGVSSAKYTEWLIKKDIYDAQYADRITHFADPMKDCLSIMYNIPRRYFDSREHKDVLWYSISEKRFITEAEACRGGSYEKVTIEMLYNKPLNHWIALRVHDRRNVIIRVRTLMQYFGTDIGRNQLGDTLWIDSTIYRAVDIAQSRRLCIIPDVRFSNEHTTIRTNPLYGGDVMIVRDNDNNSNHDSEIFDFTCKFIIDNNSSKMGLFYKAVGFVQSIL